MGGKYDRERKQISVHNTCSLTIPLTLNHFFNKKQQVIYTVNKGFPGR
jgi:hypothetical protein